MVGFFYGRTIFIYMLEDVYLNKVLSSLIRSTRFNHRKAEVYTPFSDSNVIPPYSLFRDYCERIFGLSHSEIVNVWYEYLEYIRKEINK